jgi:archaellin
MSTGIGQAVANGYKKDVGGSKPSDMVYRGYETMYWYTYLLHKYGTIFNEKFSDNAAAPFTRFEVVLKKDKDEKLLYQENKHIVLYRYQSSSYIVEQ